MTTGIVRRFDDLGRIVIPREIRRKLHISEGTPMEIFVDTEDGSLILKKYSYTNGSRQALKSALEYVRYDDEISNETRRELEEKLRDALSFLNEKEQKETW